MIPGASVTKAADISPPRPFLLLLLLLLLLDPLQFFSKQIRIHSRLGIHVTICQQSKIWNIMLQL